MMLDLSLLPDGGVSWLDASGDHAGIVLSTRIRLARNLEGFAFPGRARDAERLRVLTRVREADLTRHLENGRVLGKPSSPEDARAMLGLKGPDQVAF